MLFGRRSFVAVAMVSVVSGVAFNAQGQEKRRPSLWNPTPDDAREFAASAVKLAFEVEGKTLDYTPASLRLIDDTVLSFKQAGTPAKEVSGTLVVLGCYVGEVFVRSLGAKWDMPNDEEQKLGFKTLGVRTKLGAFWDPITKVFKLMVNGKEDSVAYLFSVAKSREP